MASCRGRRSRKHPSSHNKEAKCTKSSQPLPAIRPEHICRDSSQSCGRHGKAALFSTANPASLVATPISQTLTRNAAPGQMSLLAGPPTLRCLPAQSICMASRVQSSNRCSLAWSLRISDKAPSNARVEGTWYSRCPSCHCCLSRCHGTALRAKPPLAGRTKPLMSKAHLSMAADFSSSVQVTGAQTRIGWLSQT